MPKTRRSARRPTPAATAPAPAPAGPGGLDLAQRLSRSFVLGELLRSETAERRPELKAQQVNPPAAVFDNLRHLVVESLQPLRDRIGTPIRVTSGYRCPEVNALVGGSATSQHVQGEAADCQLSGGFLLEDAAAPVREMIRAGVKERTGKPLRANVSENFYLFAFICLHLEELDVDQVIHEYGEAFARPAWVHIAASRRQDKRQILVVGDYTNRKYLVQSPEEALALGT
jgi:hypothetical protein